MTINTVVRQNQNAVDFSVNSLLDDTLFISRTTQTFSSIMLCVKMNDSQFVFSVDVSNKKIFIHLTMKSKSVVSKEVSLAKLFICKFENYNNIFQIDYLRIINHSAAVNKT